MTDRRPQLIVLSGDDVRRAVPMKRAVEVVGEAFVELSAGSAVAPVRRRLELAAGDALVMPAYSPASGRLGVKLVTVHADNRALGLPAVNALVLLADAATGEPLAVLDGEALTALRTGAASGLATDLLARPDAVVAAVFGAGAQARTQLEAVAAVRPIERVWVIGRDPDRAARFAAEMTAAVGVPVRVVDRRQRLAEADVVCTATTATDPVFADDELGPGVHVNAVGSYRPEMREVPAATVARARVVVDERRACLAEAGELVAAIAAGLLDPGAVAEIGEVAAGRAVGRSAPDEVTLFDSVGNAVQDLAVAAEAARVAAAAGLGARCPL